MIESSEVKFKQFFEQSNRKKQNDENYEVTTFLEPTFQEIYILNSKFLPKAYKSLLDVPIFHKLKELKEVKESNNTPNNVNNKNKNCDEVFSEYVSEVSSKANKSYCLFSLKFVLLFRECINKFKGVQVDNKDFTETNNPDPVPDLCNEFITEFMENSDFFGMNSEEEKNEFIEIIQHFCFWLFNNGYTSSRLTLLSG
jgi:hypothetical protein